MQRTRGGQVLRGLRHTGREREADGFGWLHAPRVGASPGTRAAGGHSGVVRFWSRLIDPARPARPIGERVWARLRHPGRPALGWTLRLTLAAVASYVVAESLFPGAAPLTAPLTALLVVQLTPVSLLVSGIDRVVSVVAGVGLAVLLSSAVGLNWWTLGLLIGVSLVSASSSGWAQPAGGADQRDARARRGCRRRRGRGG